MGSSVVTNTSDRRRAVRSLMVGIAVAVASSSLPATSHAQSASPQAYNWSSFYISGAAGRGWREDGAIPFADHGEMARANFLQYFTNDQTSSQYSTDTSNRSGGAVSAALGYQRQFNWLVLGLEYEVLRSRLVQGPDPKTTGFELLNIPFSGFPTLTDYSIVSRKSGGEDQNWLGSLHMRAGVALDRWMVFGTGGLAHRFAGDHTTPYAFDKVSGTTTSFGQYTSTQSQGWTAGGGVEYALTDTIAAKVEYEHMEFGKSRYADAAASLAGNRVVLYSVDRNLDFVRAGISVKLDSPR